MKASKRSHLLLIVLLAATLLTTSAASSQAASVYLWASGAGDGSFYYNTKYGGNTYTTGGSTMYASLYFGAPYGNDVNNIYMEILIAALLGQTLTGAIIQLDSLGAGTGYYYGSAYVRHLNPGASSPTGNIAVDNPFAWGADASWTFFNTDGGPDGSPGIKSFDVLASVQADVAAGRSYSTFVIDASRDTGVTIYASETPGQGPRILASGETLVPIPGAVWLLGSGLLGLAGWRHRRKGR